MTTNDDLGNGMECPRAHQGMGIYLDDDLRKAIEEMEGINLFILEDFTKVEKVTYTGW